MAVLNPKFLCHDPTLNLLAPFLLSRFPRAQSVVVIKENGFSRIWEPENFSRFMVDASAARVSSRENILCAHEREFLGTILLLHFFTFFWFFWSQSEDYTPVPPLLFQDKEKHKVDSHHQSLPVRFGQNGFHHNKKGIQKWLPSTKRKPISL